MADIPAPTAPATVKLQGYGLTLVVLVGFNARQNGADDDGSPVNLLLDTGSDITWVAAHNYIPKPGVQVARPIQVLNTASASRVPPGTPEDTTEWVAHYGRLSASGTTLTAMPITFGTTLEKVAVAYASQLAIETRPEAEFTVGLLGMNLTSTIEGWPSAKAAYLPIWRQFLRRTKLPRRFAISLPAHALPGVPRLYEGTLEIGGPASIPADAVTVPVIPLPPKESATDWCVKVQFYARVPTNNSAGFDDIKLGDSLNVIPDTGCEDIYLPHDVANKYHGYLNNTQPPSAFAPVHGRRAQAPLAGTAPAHDIALVVGFANLKILPSKSKVAIPANKIIDSGGYSSVLGADPGRPLLLGMPFFLAVRQVIFNSGDAPDGQPLGNPSISVVP